MIKRSTLFLLLVVGTFFLNSSCSEEQDFNQLDDLAIEPVVASSIFYFESDEELINQVGAGAFYSEVFTFEAFAEDFIASRLVDGVLTYEIENTTSKSINLEIEFLDENDNVLDTETFNIQAEPAPVTEIQVSYGPGGKSLDILTNTRKVRVNATNLGDGSSTSSQEEPRIILRSSAAFRVRVR